jgi:hypothetical protein
MENNLAVFMATHSSKCKPVYKYIIPIQVGAKLNNNIIENVTDSTKDSISEKNNIYCELTGTYWIWKNTNYQYLGLCHYRRYFQLEYNQIESILQKKDIILPRKRIFRISIEEQYKREHYNKNWDIMLEVLKKSYPKYYETSKRVFSDNKLYAYNMLITKQSIFNNYCEWLFGVLQKVQTKISLSDLYKPEARYIGFIGERLLTLYVIHNGLDVKEEFIVFNDSQEKNNIKNKINNILFKVKNNSNKGGRLQ